MSSYLATGTEVLFPERINNLSAGGVNLTLSQPLAPGTVGTLDLYNLHRDFPFQVSVRVAYAYEQADGSFNLGCVFSRELNNSEVWGLL
jgi:PilZ domain-containing protein